MRNYIKTRAMHWVAYELTTPQNDLVAWGGTDEEMLYYVMRLEALYLDSNPNLIFRRTPPRTCWWELNRANFLLILNRSINSAFEAYAPTRLNNGEFSVNSFPNDTFYHMTRVEAQGSPRKTWSHGH